jgi:hypothetical protein
MEIIKLDNCTIKLHKNKLHLIIDIRKIVGFAQHTSNPILCNLPFQIFQLGVHRFFFKLFLGRSKKKFPEIADPVEQLKEIINR